MNITDENKDLSPHYTFEVKKQNFLIKIATRSDELVEAFKLRNKVYSAHSNNFSGDIDQDTYDQEADHILVIDQEKNKIVGTYRLLLSDKVTHHYSAREFDLKNFLPLPGRKLELGRACVDPDMRTGVIITLLWRGIAEYVKLCKADYLFGCSTVWDADINDAYLLFKFFKKHNLTSEIQAQPLERNYPVGWPTETEITNETNEVTAEEAQKAKALLPALVKTYISTGAKFCTPPAFDPKLEAFEFFGYLKMSDINPAFKRKYLDK